MSHSSITDRRPALVQVWTGLALERQGQVIRLMAQLALKLVLAQSPSLLKEVKHALPDEPIQHSN